MKALFAPVVSAMDWEGRGTPALRHGNLGFQAFGSIDLKVGLLAYIALRKH
jgi:hypothetical protein